MCGEHPGSGTTSSRREGSSPRVRGTPGVPSADCTARGIIPACAGNTLRDLCQPSTKRDHPRVCGEHPPFLRKIASSPGSSPRVRGTRGRVRGGRGARGIIPACAGNTRQASRPILRDRDHPRVCGEHSFALGLRFDALGSSPRVRGTPTIGAEPQHLSGIIPACAGNTRGCSGRRSRSRDHPRVCGEHSYSRSSPPSSTGSSPRVRGTLRGRRAWRPRAGIIPACAGNTRYPP